MLVGPSKALFMDEISTGLDSSTTYQIVNSIRQSIHILKGTALISLLQPAPETYDLFDDIILVADGQIVYQGPREHVLEFFEYMGFKCPERKGAADFLQEVKSPAIYSNMSSLVKKKKKNLFNICCIIIRLVSYLVLDNTYSIGNINERSGTVLVP